MKRSSGSAEQPADQSETDSTEQRAQHSTDADKKRRRTSGSDGSPSMSTEQHSTDADKKRRRTSGSDGPPSMPTSIKFVVIPLKAYRTKEERSDVISIIQKSKREKVQILNMSFHDEDQVEILWWDLADAMTSTAEQPGFHCYRDRRLMTLVSLSCLAQVRRPLRTTNPSPEDQVISSICLTFDTPAGDKILNINTSWPRMGARAQERLLSAYMDQCQDNVKLYGSCTCLVGGLLHTPLRLPFHEDGLKFDIISIDDVTILLRDAGHGRF